eukprot:2178923-Amphidinium_carterae.1
MVASFRLPGLRPPLSHSLIDAASLLTTISHRLQHPFFPVGASLGTPQLPAARRTPSTGVASGSSRRGGFAAKEE